ncbi:hypothetical protein F5Y15DRAFT_351135 [Xylariaceae sp. FL0016]|nr:hypothetical protein F5Y15DRAFT_351135 [Xylariaceae sp. FL0016]
MEPLRLKPRQPVEDNVEDWDDDDFMIDNDDDLTFRSQSTHNQSQPNRRESTSSFRSDRESLPGGDERHVHLPGDDEQSTLNAIATATHAGIPIPTNVPPSALMGGTIKRLGGRKMKKIFQEDWGEDLELPTSGQALRLKVQDGKGFPDILRQVSGSTIPSPVKLPAPTSPAEIPASDTIRPKTLAPPINLDRFRDTEEDDDFFGDASATIKASKLRPQSKLISLITPPTPSPAKRADKTTEDDDFENDLELPSDGKLRLSSRKDIPKTPALQASDDFDWGEGSLGTRFGGTKRDAFSARSSSVSALSPSIASSMTAESEDDTFDGLVFPIGPLDLSDRLKQRKDNRSPVRRESGKHQVAQSPRSPEQILPKTVLPPCDPHKSSPVRAALQLAKEEDDPFSGLELGDGPVFRHGKSTLHRNIKVKETRPASPARPKTAVSITFTNKPITSTSSRLPRPMGSHERSHTASSLEPVSESGDPIPLRPSRRSQSRLGHSAHSSISSVHTPTTPSQPTLPSTPKRRELGQKASTGALRNEPTTTNAQLLRLKRSLPVMRSSHSPAKPPSRFDRPPSRTDSRNDLNRSQTNLRPKTPVDRARHTPEGSTTQVRKGPVPFLPAGAAQHQSHNVNARTARGFKRNEFDQGSDLRPVSRAFSRTAMRSPSPRRIRHEKSSSEPVWQQINKPRRLKQFGDGHELDAFDDLPTSAHTESKYTKQPVGSGNRTNIRNKIYQNVLPDRNTPSPISPYSPARSDHLPHFARDTAASRNAREAALAQRANPTGPLTPLTSQRVAQLATRTNFTPSTPHGHHSRGKKSRKTPQLKPHLISNLNSSKETRVIGGMTYNPNTYRWEGNENVLNAFDVPASSPSTASLPPYMIRDREASTPRPVLITQIGASKNAKRVGDMVFDPQNMCWLKVDISTPTTLRSDDPLESFNTIDEDDPFKDIPDLEEKEPVEGNRGRVSDVREDWLVGEEFDVGPEFIKRQYEEEVRWHRKCERWLGIAPNRKQSEWRWTIRDMIMEG